MGGLEDLGLKVESLVVPSSHLLPPLVISKIKRVCPLLRFEV